MHIHFLFTEKEIHMMLELQNFLFKVQNQKVAFKHEEISKKKKKCITGGKCSILHTLVYVYIQLEQQKEELL